MGSKQNPFSINRLPPGPVSKSKSICPRHPDLLVREVIRRLAAASSTGISAPPRFSPSCPHLLRRFDRARLYGRTGVSLSLLPVIAAPGAARCLQPAVSRSLPDGTNRRPVLNKVASRCFRPADHGAAAEVAHAFGKSNRKVPDE